MNKFLFNKMILCISLVLIPLSIVVGWGVVKKWNHDFTLLGPYGDFFAGTTVPMLTFASFIAVMMTLNQQQEQLKIQKKEIEESRKTKVLENLRERIINVDESLDIINSNLETLSDLIEIGEQSNLELFHLDNNYRLLQHDLIYSIVERDMKSIRKILLRTDTIIYEDFLFFHNDVKTIYSKNIHSIEQKFLVFERQMREKYPLSILAKELEPEFSNNNYESDDYDQLNLLYSSLHINEKVYIKELYNSYVDMKYKLDRNMTFLIEELKKN